MLLLLLLFLLTLQAATWLNLLIGSGDFFVDSIDFLHEWSCHLQMKKILLFPLQCECFLLLILPIEVVITTSTIFNKTLQRKHFCLVLNLVRKLFSLSPLSVIFEIHFFVSLCVCFILLCSCNLSGWGSFPLFLLR